MAGPAPGNRSSQPGPAASAKLDSSPVLRWFFPGAAQPSNSGGGWPEPQYIVDITDFPDATTGTINSPTQRNSQPDALREDVLTKHKGGARSCPHHSPKPTVLAAASHQQRKKKSHLAVLILATVPDRQD